ncbi:unnamed protein product, partial [Linum tenue]
RKQNVARTLIHNPTARQEPKLPTAERSSQLPTNNTTPCPPRRREIALGVACRAHSIPAARGGSHHRILTTPLELELSSFDEPALFFVSAADTSFPFFYKVHLPTEPTPYSSSIADLSAAVLSLPPKLDLIPAIEVTWRKTRDRFVAEMSCGSDC